MAVGSPTRVLVVDDDSTVLEVLSGYLARDGFEVHTATEAEAALALAARVSFDLAVVDIMLPGRDGFALCRELRQAAAMPVVFLSARGQEEDRVSGLDFGADDYVPKPFSPREVVARVRAVLRRTQVSSEADGQVAILRAGPLTIDLPAREVTRDGQLVNLTIREFDLLAFLAGHPRETFSREQLLERVWGWTYGGLATVTVHVRRLREKVERDPTVPCLIKTVWGVGYRWDS
ncbi:MAG: response regulator [Acidimicrobiales bacterium]